MSRGRRFDGEPKLNIKKVVAVLIAIAVIVMIVVMVWNLLKKGNDKGKITSNSYYASFKDNKWGVIDSSGNNVIDPSYQEMIVVPSNKKDLFICTYDVDYTNGTYKTKVLNSKNEEIFTTYDKVEAISNNDESGNMWYEENVLKVEKNGKYGLTDLTGKEILSVEYDEIGAVKGIENALTIKQEEKYGIASDDGKIVIKPEYKEITNLGKDNKSGYIVQDNTGKYGVVDYSNNKILECKYDAIEKKSGNNMYVVTESGNIKVVDKSGKDILTKGFDSIFQISESVGDNAGVIFEKNNKYGYMKETGEILIDASYEKLQESKAGYLIAKENEKYGVIDLEKNEKIPFDYTIITYSKEAAIYAADDENFNSKLFNDNFEEKLSGMLIEINTDKDYIKMKIGDEYKFYNFKFEEKNAKEVLSSTNTLYLSKQNGKFGFVDSNGKVIVDYIYDDATEQNECGYAGIKKAGKWGSIDNKGNIIIEPTYNLDEYLQVDFIGKWHKGLDLNMNYYNQE